jgi:hypothetical protein
MAYQFNELNKVMQTWATDYSGNELSITEVEQNNITCFAGGTEMLKVAEDGFYVRGTKVPVDDKEAETVYNAFKEFLVWSRLHRD